MKPVFRILVTAIVLISFCFLQETQAQTLTESFIKAWVIHLDSTKMEQMDQALYIVNGSPSRPPNVFSLISDYSFSKQRVEFTYLSSDKAGRINHKNGPVIILSTNVVRQKRKRVKKELQKARRLFKGPLLKTSNGMVYKKEPAVMLEGKPLDSPTAKALLQKARVSYFETILVSETAPPSLFGTNAKNGLIRIWLKK